MMQLKRILVSLLVAIMMLSMAVVAVSAADTASATFDVTVEPVGVTADIEGNIPVTPGDTVEINVVINNNPGVCATSFDVVFDAAALEYDASGVVNGDVYEIYAVTPATGKVSVFTDMMAEEDVTSVGTIIKLTFKVKDNFTGDKTKISVNNVLAINANMDPVGATGSDAHNYDYTNATVVAPTCEEGGYTYAVCTLHLDCIKKYDEVDALGHKTEKIDAVEATCSTDGNTAGEKCTVEDCDYNTSEAVPATGEHVGEAIPGVEATCTSIGLTEGSKCKDCGIVLVVQETIEATGHTEETIAAVEATCSSTGLTEGKKCSVCGIVIAEQTVVEAKDHTAETIPAVAATCTAAGSTEGKKCSVCDAVIIAPEVVQPTGHTLREIPAVEPTYSKAGSTAGQECSVCNEIIDATSEIPAKSLAWLWVLIICVVVVAGGGAALYFLVLRKKLSK